MIVDIHSHILPGIDDGSKSMEMTLEMLKNMEKSGVKEIVATPHYLLEYAESTIEEVKALVSKVNTYINEEKINIKPICFKELGDGVKSFVTGIP